MKSLRSAVLAMVFLAAMMTGVAILGTLGRMVKAGKLEAEALITGIIVFLALLLLCVIIAVVMAFRKHKAHLAQSSSRDILADLIAMGEAEKQRKAQETQGLQDMQGEKDEEV